MKQHMPNYTNYGIHILSLMGGNLKAKKMKKKMKKEKENLFIKK